MKKVLHIPNYYYPHIGGIEQVTRDCVNALKGKYEQRIICFNSDKNTIKETVDDVPITRVGKNVEVLSQSICLSYKKELRDIIDNFNPDIIVFHYPNPSKDKCCCGNYSIFKENAQKHIMRKMSFSLHR